MVAAAQATGAMETMTTEAPGPDGLVLRYGQFYGPGTYYARDGSIAREVGRRRFPIVGDGAGMFSFVHLDDAAAATVLALDRGPAGIYNVCDDEPAPLREWLPLFAQTLGAKPPRRVPRWLARLVAGPIAVASTTELRGASNAKAKRELGWSPRYPSWRQGFGAALA
jgi:nucleoside-diphosphate-sugar epimerase